MRIELVYAADCPHVEAARLNLTQALIEEGLPLAWTEWDLNDATCPLSIRGFGSPAILVNGRDVSGFRPTDGAACCRQYRSAAGAAGAPSVDLIRISLRPAQTDLSGRSRGGVHE